MKRKEEEGRREAGENQNGKSGMKTREPGRKEKKKSKTGNLAL